MTLQRTFPGSATHRGDAPALVQPGLCSDRRGGGSTDSMMTNQLSTATAPTYTSRLTSIARCPTGVAGFEPTHVGTKLRGLATWLYPNGASTGQGECHRQAVPPVLSAPALPVGSRRSSCIGSLRPLPDWPHHQNARHSTMVYMWNGTQTMCCSVGDSVTRIEVGLSQSYPRF